MIKDIKYNGYTAQPSDYESPDGQLAASINLISEDSQLKPILQPRPISIGLTPMQKVTYIHETSAYRHYIILEGKILSWLDGASLGDSTPAPATLATFTDLDIHQISAIGNTLVILCSDGIHYFLWKADKNAYTNLGSAMPECSLSFGLRGEMKRTDEFDISFSIHKDNIYSEFDDEQKTAITDQVLAKINKFIAEESTRKGKFIFPFFVRYAYRLYDGSLTRHSAPILMICSSENTPRVFWFNLSGDDDTTYTHAKLRVVAPVHNLDYALMSDLSNLKRWSDIIKSVDIFVSAPIYTYDQNGQCERFINGGVDLSGFSVCKHTNQAASTTTYPLRYQINNFGKLYAFTFTPDQLNTRPGGILVTPSRSADAVKEDIRACSQFYFLHSIRVEDLKTQRTLIPVKDDYLQSLVAREVMTDDYDSHDRLIPTQAFPYNSRLNLSGIKKRLFQGFDGYSLFNYSNGYVMHYDNNAPTLGDTTFGVLVAVYIKQDGKDIIVYGSGGFVGNAAPLLFFYYPNVNAYKAVIIRTVNIDVSHVVIPLEPHAFLNGAFYFGGWKEPQAESTMTRPTAATDAQRTIDILNKVYTSEVNNPFHFPLLGINTVGTGRIIAISTAAKALSQGQFGQFPLYAFTDEGVWALEVSATGSYSARQPITRDVILDGTEPLQMDSAVLFATDRGIMLISGSQTQCITDVINSQWPFNVLDLPGMDRLHTMLGHEADTCLPTAPFLDFISKCGMLYDYVHQHVILYNPDYTYAYIYSLRSKEWGMAYSTIQSGINSYPEALAVDRDGKLLNYSANDGTPAKGLMVTRPLKFEVPDVLKTVDTVIQRGNFRRGHVQSVLYGSRDLIHWHLVWSSKDHYLRGFRGTPYKYFRIACLTSLADAESLFGAAVQFTPRLTDQPR
ncbi:MAG: hypothetical protein J6K19_03840 [Prevotella sp.]|nr:hypothetical protein [Prevotella sp.]